MVGGQLAIRLLIEILVTTKTGVRVFYRVLENNKYDYYIDGYLCLFLVGGFWFSS